MKKKNLKNVLDLKIEKISDLGMLSVKGGQSTSSLCTINTSTCRPRPITIK
jgi:hypothetical protein